MKHAILIVDDEFGLAEVVGDVLTESGYRVSIAINGELALQSMQQTRPDLVLLDSMMPIMDGATLLSQMRASRTFASIPAVVMTALPEALPKDQTLYDAVLIKPFTPDQLLSTIEPLLAKA